MSLAFLFHYLMLNTFRMLIDPSSGACDLSVELFHGLQSNTTHEIIQQISRKLLRMDVLTSETCWALNNEIKKQVTSSCSLFIHLLGNIKLLFFTGVLLLFYVRQFTLSRNKNSRLYEPSPPFHKSDVNFVF